MEHQKLQCLGNLGLYSIYSSGRLNQSTGIDAKH